MKNKFIALLCALALVFSLAGCTLSTPDTVGKIGDYEIPSGLYLLAQYDAYQKAADLASSEQDASDVKGFLKATITPEGEDAVTVRDYVARETLKNLETYAAVETRFAELGGELTEEETQQADSYAAQLMDQYGDTYKANGIGLETVQRFERILLKSSDLLELCYGADGETPVSDAELTDHVENSMYALAYYSIPLYNTSTFAFANDDQKAQMLALAQAAADATNAFAAETSDTSTVMGYFSGQVTSALPEIYKVLDSTVPADSDAPQTELIGDAALTSAFTAEGSADTIRSLTFGQAAAVQYNGYALLVALRLDPLAANTLDDLRSQILSDKMSQTLQDALAEYGAALDHDLDSSAMNKLPVKKIVNSNSSNSNS